MKKQSKCIFVQNFQHQFYIKLKKFQITTGHDLEELTEQTLTSNRQTPM